MFSFSASSSLGLENHDDFIDSEIRVRICIQKLGQSERISALHDAQTSGGFLSFLVESSAIDLLQVLALKVVW